jgi:hypothetical protein
MKALLSSRHLLSLQLHFRNFCSWFCSQALQIFWIDQAIHWNVWTECSVFRLFLQPSVSTLDPVLVYIMPFSASVTLGALSMVHLITSSFSDTDNTLCFMFVFVVLHTSTYKSDYRPAVHEIQHMCSAYNLPPARCVKRVWLTPLIPPNFYYSPRATDYR